MILVVTAKAIHIVYQDLENNDGFKIKCVHRLMTMKIRSLSVGKMINLLVWKTWVLHVTLTVFCSFGFIILISGKKIIFCNFKYLPEYFIQCFKSILFSFISSSNIFIGNILPGILHCAMSRWVPNTFNPMTLELKRVWVGSAYVCKHYFHFFFIFK